MRYFFNYIIMFFLGIGCILSGSPGKDGVCMIAHRGYSSQYVENTASAFLAAAEHGSGGIETDVRITKDNKLILSHDSTAEYKDGTSLSVADSTFAELTEKPLLNKFGNDDIYMCSFEEYLDICKQNNMVCFLDLKGGFSHDVLSAMYTAIEQHYTPKMCSLQSSDFDNLVRAYELFPELDIMFTYGRTQFEDGPDYTRCFEYGFDIDVDYSVITRDMVKEFHDRGLKIGVWTCNNVLVLNYAYALNVDYIESDIF